MSQIVQRDFEVGVGFGSVVITGAGVTTSAAILANPGYFQQIITDMKAPAVVASLILDKITDAVENILTDPTSLLHWTENEWAIFHGWLRHIGIALIHLKATDIL